MKMYVYQEWGNDEIGPYTRRIVSLEKLEENENLEFVRETDIKGISDEPTRKTYL
jgi:hypothetical protein